MRSAVAIPAAATATEHSQRTGERWQILGVATATEHSELSVAAERETALAPRVISIGSVKFFRAARHDRATRAMAASAYRDRRHSVTTQCQILCARTPTAAWQS